MKTFSIFIFLSLLFIVSCTKKIDKVSRAFYYWKNNEWQLSTIEQESVKKIGIKKLYIKFFEIEYSDAMGCYPVAKTSMNYYQLDSLELIPTIFINNEALKNSTLKDMDELANNINFLVGKYCKQRFNDLNVNNEIQVDCDWTLKTKEKYFYLLKKIKDVSKKDISCTLRLYPYKYSQKMGVPPVDRVTLMCYNLLNPLENHNKNSILDIDELKSYLNINEKYPLHLDVALPIYSWMQVYQNNLFSKIIYTDATSIKSILKSNKPLWYDVTKDTVVDNFYMRIGDKVKLEEVNSTKLLDVIALLKKEIEFDSETTITLFHLDDKQISQFKIEELNSFYTDFGK